MRTDKSNKRFGRTVTAVCIVCVCALFTAVSAKYIYNWASANRQAVSDNFYFTTNLTGDTEMFAQDDGVTYKFGEESTVGTWHLFGGVQHNIVVNVQNYYDEYRVTGRNITYTAEVTENEHGVTVSKTSGTIDGGNAASDDVTLTIPSYSAWHYAENTEVVLTIKSTAPYEKTFTLTFVIHTADNSLKYRVNDSVGRPYAELVIMSSVTDESGEIGSVQPYIIWPDSLYIDNTNNLTFTGTNGNFTPQSGIEERNMQVSQPFATGRSESIAFFKQNPNDNFSCPDLVVLPTGDKYVIDLNNITEVKKEG